MRTGTKVLSTLIGVVILAAAAVMLWTAHGPQATEAVTTGGVSFYQQEIAAGETITAATDVDLGGNPVLVPVEPNLSVAAASDLATLDQAEAAAAPPPPAAEVAPLMTGPEAVPLTTDVVINENTAVEVAPLVVESAPTAAGQGGSAGALGGGYEQRVVELEWPSEFQVGRGGSVRFKLKMLDSGALQPVAEIADHEIVATPILFTETYYETHNAFVTAVLSAPDFSVQATSPLRQRVTQGGEAEWRYTLKSNDAGRSDISIGLSLSWNPIDATGDPGPQDVPIWGQMLRVDVNHVFGLITVPQASIAGTALAVLGFIAEAPLLSTILEALLERFLKRGDKKRENKKERQ